MAASRSASFLALPVSSSPAFFISALHSSKLFSSKGPLGRHLKLLRLHPDARIVTHMQQLGTGRWTTEEAHKKSSYITGWPNCGMLGISTMLRQVTPDVAFAMMRHGMMSSTGRD